MKNKILLFIISIVIFLFSCETLIDPHNNIQQSNNSRFNFSTSEEVAFKVNAKSRNGNPIDGQPVQIFQDNNLLTTGRTDKQGKFFTNLVLPSYKKQVTVKTADEEAFVSVQNGNSEYNYSGENSLSKSSSIIATNTDTSTFNGYEFTFDGFSNNNDGTSTWTYTITGVAGQGPGVKDLSYWVLALCDDHIVDNANPNKWEVVNDNNTGVYGIKWEQKVGKDGGAKTFSFTLDDQYQVGDVEVAFKAGPDSYYSTINGPSCTEYIKYQYNYYPGENKFGTLAYEDKWPIQGDYDFNDLILGYNFKHKIEIINGGPDQLVKIDGTLVIRATGARYENGFGIELDNISSSQVDSVKGYKLTGSYIQLAENGVEQNQTNAVIIPFDNTYSLFDGDAKYINTGEYGPTSVEPDTLRFSIHFSGVDANAINLPPYDPFLIIDKVRAHEVHLTDHDPTDLAAIELFGTDDDSSNVEKGQYYIDRNNMPWALHFTEEFAYPKERMRIDSAYKYFNDWAESDGTEYENWYSDENSDPNYKDEKLIY
ncbi:MAG: LruC domain-containing protein [Candidatus Marinimicrobia bacterium]|nr:LruC domain-containing protein [Candidatus Neomarinimicrobiota bacterium]